MTLAVAWPCHCPFLEDRLKVCGAGVAFLLQREVGNTHQVRIPPTHTSALNLNEGARQRYPYLSLFSFSVFLSWSYLVPCSLRYGYLARVLHGFAGDQKGTVVEMGGYFIVHSLVIFSRRLLGCPWSICLNE